MAGERISIMQGLQSQLWALKDTKGIKLVEWYLRKKVTLSVLPAIFLLDLGDEVMQVGPFENKRLWTIGTALFISGVADTTMQTLGEFQDAIKEQVFLYGNQIGKTHKAFITESLIEPVLYPETDNNVIAQVTHFQLKYVESLRSRWT